MSHRKGLAWARLMGLLRPISRVLKSERPLCGARCRDGHACRAKAAWDGVEPYNGHCRIHGAYRPARGPRRAGIGYPPPRRRYGPNIVRSAGSSSRRACGGTGRGGVRNRSPPLAWGRLKARLHLRTSYASYTRTATPQPRERQVESNPTAPNPSLTSTLTETIQTPSMPRLEALFEPISRDDHFEWVSSRTRQGSAGQGSGRE